MRNLSFTEKFDDYAVDDSFELIGRINEELRNLNYFALLVVYCFLCEWPETVFSECADRVALKVENMARDEAEA